VQLYVYPIKSIRGVEVSEAGIVQTGFQHDRKFMLLKVEDATTTPPKLRNMGITHFTQMALFTTSISGDALTVFYSPPGAKEDEERFSIEIPLSPDIDGLETLDIVMHQSPTIGYAMDSKYSEWFSSHFGFETILSYIGANKRPVLGTFSPKAQKSTPKTPRGLWGSISSYIPVLGGGSSSGSGNSGEVDVGISFADCASFLVISETSFAEASSRLEGEEMDITKFRANVVVAGAEEAWEEDHWREVVISRARQVSCAETGPRERDVVIKLTKNCVRCASLNVDYATGKAGTGVSGQMLKKLMKDRRVDGGAKYSPVFGRYGYLEIGEVGGGRVKVGDAVSVVGKNAEIDFYGTSVDFSLLRRCLVVLFCFVLSCCTISGEKLTRQIGLALRIDGTICQGIMISIYSITRMKPKITR
jgi:uncharacterized protein YcbX